VGILEPRGHVDDPRDLSDAMLADMGIMLARVERAVLAV
jgi:diadenosine tetraphosphate (Ap4A) HIT family hydrolase